MYDTDKMKNKFSIIFLNLAKSFKKEQYKTLEQQKLFSSSQDTNFNKESILVGFRKRDTKSKRKRYVRSLHMKKSSLVPTHKGDKKHK